MSRFDVVIIGAGLAGLTLARHLLLKTKKSILLLERRAQIPSPRQKVGESTVQLGAYYYARVLDLEEHLWRDQLLKYNLRFYWKTPGRLNDALEDYSQAYIRPPSNIACYQLDRNRFEDELLRLNVAEPRLRFEADVQVDVEVRKHDGHRVTFARGRVPHTVEATWVVDTSGRGKCLARRLNLSRPSAIHHGTSYFWVDGTLDIERLTSMPRDAVRLAASRRATGHFPQWLATNHFMNEGLWFWVIPLRGRTSLGLVYDNRLVRRQEVETPERLCEWLAREFPLFTADLATRRIVDRGSFRDFSYDCAQTISPERWAISGEAGRFTDPFYSPGSDLISIHNTLIAHAIQHDDDATTACHTFEQLMRVMYQATVPTYAVSYNVLGDQEAFVLKYTWELSVYFAFYVFPFINDLLTNPQFIPGYLARFVRLGRLNASLQQLLCDFARWKLQRPGRAADPVFHDFTQIDTLRRAEHTFYCVGVGAAEALRVLDDQLAHLQELARFIAAHVHGAVVGDPGAVTNGAFVDSLVPATLRFDPAAMRAAYAGTADSVARYRWTFDADAMAAFHVPRMVETSRSVPLAV